MEKHVNFVQLGPQKVNLEAYQSKCKLGLFVAQDQQPGFGVKTNEMAVIISKIGLYPYNIYDIEVDDIDK